jgi:hypothetical protein
MVSPIEMPVLRTIELEKTALALVALLSLAGNHNEYILILIFDPTRLPLGGRALSGAMSMYFNRFTPAGNRRYGRALAEIVYTLRLDLGLSIPKAAELAGVGVWHWEALEQALWIPEDGPEMRAIADTLQVRCTTLSYWAGFSRC